MLVMIFMAMKHHDQRNKLGKMEKELKIIQFLQYVIEVRQDRSANRTGTWKARTDAKAIKGVLPTGLLPMAYPVCFLLETRTTNPMTQ